MILRPSIEKTIQLCRRLQNIPQPTGSSSKIAIPETINIDGLNISDTDTCDVFNEV